LSSCNKESREDLSSTWHWLQE